MIEKKSMPTDYLVKAADKDEMEEFQIEVENVSGGEVLQSVRSAYNSS